MKKDVLVLCQYFYPEYVSSATLPTELAEDLVEKGLTVDVVCGYPKEYFNGKKVANKEKYKGITIRRVNYTEFNNKTKLGRIINFFSFFLAVLLRFFSFFNYKCIIVYSNPPILPLIPYLIGRLSGVEFIFVAFDVYPDNALKLGAIKKGSTIEKIMNYINSKVYRYSSKVVALSQEMKEYLLNQKIAVNPESINVIPNWYSDEKVNNNTIENIEFKTLKENWPFIILYSGNMGSAQDMDTILQCMSQFKNNKNVLFVFTGHGNKVNYVKNYIYSNKISNAKVYGFLLGDDYKDVLQMADVCLVSLAEGIEGIGVPSKTYGYLAVGKPVIAIMSNETDIAKSLIKYNAGGNVKQGDFEGLEVLIQKYMDNPELLQLMGLNAKQLFLNLYERKICTELYYNMLSKIINKNSKVG
ncbi:glycosyltransferase family 4 protein [Peribacillus frigoritolerans]|uniref:glycosyltransferase family 4 protein n=1 Tax=Peribacillus frigoritolerans TaxID=450367 RepID=UPI00342D0FF8